MADPIQALSDWLLYAVGGALTLVGGYAKRVDTTSKRALEKAEKNERALEGSDDPNHRGVLEIAHETNRKIDQLEERMEQQHRMLMDEVKSMREENGEFYRGGGSDPDPADD